MDEPNVPAAPAQPDPTPQTQSAAHAAVAADDTSAYRAARRAERAGKPLADVPVAPATDPATPAPAAPAAADPAAPAQPVSNRQQKTNDAIREAVERAIAPLNEEIARLRQGQAPPPAAPAQPATPEKQEPAYKRFAAMPDAPKLEDFDTIGEHTAAMSYFIAEKMMAERATAAAASARGNELTAAQQTRVDGFVKQLDAAKVADPEFVGKLSTEVRALKPFAALLPGESGGPLNVIAEQVYDSPIVDKVLIELSKDGSKELKRLATAPAHVMALPPAARVEAHLKWIVREFGKLEGRLETPAAAAPATPPAKTLTDAPPAAQVLGQRPAEAGDPMASAVKSGSTRAYRQLRRQQRVAAMTGR